MFLSYLANIKASERSDHIHISHFASIYLQHTTSNSTNSIHIITLASYTSLLPNMQQHSRFSLVFLSLLFLFLSHRTPIVAAQAQPISGAIFTTNSACTQVNGNIYDNKGDVYLDGGPPAPGAAGLPDGFYWVQVTDPSGAVVLGKR